MIPGDNPPVVPPPPAKESTVTQVVSWLSSEPFLHVAGIVAITVLIALGTVSTAEGFPILTGLVGLGINTGK